MSNSYLPNLTQVWPEEEGSNTIDVEIIAVHGLGSKPDTTWVKNDVNWLNEPSMLPKKLPKSRIWTFNFSSDLKGPAPLQDLESLGYQLLQFIYQKLVVPNRPIVFVAHSFGGILVAQALTVRSSDQRHVQMLNSVKGALFLGTPFHGSPKAFQAKLLGLGSNNSKALMECIDPDSKQLKTITGAFSELAKEKPFRVVCVFEQIPTKVIKKGRLRPLGKVLETIIVPQSHACLDGHDRVGINASHTEMNEFDNPHDGNYELVSGQVLDILRSPLKKEGERNVIFMSPYMENDYFVGRQTILDIIFQRMEYQVNTQTRLALYGIGGIGKTSIVTYYVYSIKYGLEQDGQSLFFIHAGSRERFVESYIKLAKAANIYLPTDNEEENLRTVADWLGDPSNGYWIMILDNADDIDIFTPPSNLPSFIPRCDHGIIIITSRFKKVCTTLTDAKSLIHVDNMDIEDCRNLVHRRLSTSPPTEDVEDLIETLEYIPFALSQAAGFMEDNFMSIPKYLSLWRESSNRVQLLGGGESTNEQENTQDHVSTTWFISFHRISEKYPLAADILCLISYFDRQDIPKFFLFRTDIMSVTEFEAALGTLQGYSMINASSDGDAFNMHALVQLAIRTWLEGLPKPYSYMERAVKTLCDHYPLKLRDTFPRSDCSRYLPHALAILGHWKVARRAKPIPNTKVFNAEVNDYESQDQINTEHQMELAIKVAQHLKAERKYEEAKQVYLDALELAKPVPVERLIVSMFLSSTQEDETKRDELRTEVFDSSQQYCRPFYGITFHNVCEKGYLTEPDQIYDIDRRRPSYYYLLFLADGGVLRTSRESFVKTGFGLEIWGAYESALLEAILLMKITHRVHEPRMLLLQQDLAEVYYEQKKFRESKELYSQVLEMQRKNNLDFGMDHKETIKCMLGLATCYARGYTSTEERELGRKIGEEARSILTEFLGIDHPETQKCIEILDRIDPPNSTRKNMKYMEERKSKGHRAVGYQARNK